ncbi:MAG TPA: heparan-alpha-glucosaminide N-acetyltransferase domain-containing protein [Vicinamibacterales bacterium]|nr:heparan-alpha-glucosaminide N-acetyltransferase domain-containing protein [Vicinamibacterales bacterium]
MTRPGKVESGLTPGHRLASLDIIRGVVMILMAIDHVRVYSGVPAGGPTAAIFFTRWVTHFCAPAFVFFAGTAAFLHGRKLGDTGTLARYLVVRGLLLVLLELTVIRFSWTFNVDYSQFVLAGVIWMTGWCMVLLAAFVRLSPRTVGIAGLLIILFQQTFSFFPRALPASVRAFVGPIWEFVYPAGSDGWLGMTVLYTIVPWIGVMAAGHGFGAILLRASGDRRRLCLRIGLTATALFVVFTVVIDWLSPSAGETTPGLFRLLSASKYPASPLFLLMTLGPTIAVLPLVERSRGWIADVVGTFGRVPMFYYLLHIPTIHVTALLVNLLRTGSANAGPYATAPYVDMPQADHWPLWLLYVVFVVDVVLLYFPCRWYADLKARRRSRWLSYV